ncbi:hypothetical protein POF50_021450 [Streptomyces sp. SL13]|uniref:FtsK domain-containing protein n=1 Tax=Streptantibioticus silvisoli TaxID=2705255 RepID=A0AA90H7C0_9ACTN|nr:hypothetical protein [Streptantibioticus silvisoli]MDI5971867.1 hypothetical protein [Streptantibioticus silvisoli]
MSSNNAKVQPRWRVDWNAGHGPLTGTINATTGALTATTLAHAAGLPAWWALAAGAAGAVGTIGAGLRKAVSGAMLSFRGGCWLAAGSWSAWAMHTGPVQPAALGALAVTGIAAGTLSVAFAHREETEQARRTTLITLGARRALAVEWIDRLERVCRITGATIPGIEQWPAGTGYTVEVELPEGGTTRRAVADRTDALASDLDLPNGCGVQVLPGISRRRVLILIQTRSMAGTVIAYPTDNLTEHRTVNNPLPVALLPDGGLAELDMRQASTVVAGPTGSGKTNWLHTLIARFNETNDVLVWVIDLNGGSIGLPWLHAWREAQQGVEGSRWAGADIPTPGVDWVASTPAEAALMLKAAVRIAKSRKVAYQDHMRTADDDKLPVSPQVPEIVIVMDEGAEVAATREAKQVMAGISEVIRIARAMAIRAVVSVLRVTQDVLPDPMVRKMAANRVCTGATEDSELGHIFGWRALSAEDSFHGPGSLLVGVDGKQPQPGQQWRITPRVIEEVCAATAHRRPTLDKPSFEAAGTDYAQRWTLERCGHLWSTATVPDSGPAGGGSSAGGERRWKATASWDKPTESRVETPAVSELEAMFNLPAAARDGEPAAPQAGGTDWSDPSAWTTGREKAEPDQADARQAALTLLLAAGPDGTGASAIAREMADDFGTNRQTVVGWLKAWVETGEAVRIGTGTKSRYVHRQHAPNGHPDN